MTHMTPTDPNKINASSDQSPVPIKLRLTKKIVREALITARGNISHAARVLGYARNTIYDFMKKNPELNLIVEDARETMVDTAESALSLAITKQQPWAISLILRTIGRSRGYVEKTENTLDISELNPLIAEMKDKLDDSYAAAAAAKKRDD